MSQTVSALLSLRNMILNGTLVPGERLTEIATAERLGVSRTPLRAALAQLATEGLLDAVATGGYAVRGFGATDVNDAIQLRGVLEGMAARFAAERGASTEQLSTMRGILSGIDALLRARHDDSAFQDYVDLNGRFHAGLVEMANSAVVAREITRVTALPFASPSAFVMAQSAAPDAWDILVIAQDQHHAMLDAIEAREGARAEALMREHARVALRNLHRVLGEHGLPAGPTLTLVAGAAPSDQKNRRRRRPS
jgi:GntR family transcriptional regulator of vanillate catabolism